MGGFESYEEEFVKMIVEVEVRIGGGGRFLDGKRSPFISALDLQAVYSVPEYTVEIIFG